jgi:hypothetical protein
LAAELLPVRLRTVFNSAYPSGRNDGALRTGRGLSASLGIGAAARWGPLSAAIAPQALYHGNRGFETSGLPRPPGSSPYTHPWYPNRIDWPVRFGDEPYWTLDPGPSYLRLDAYGVALGISNENLWWGPALHSPLLMSDNAPGFPHLFLGTTRAMGTPLGAFETQLVWGRLEESGYFNDRAEDDRRLFAGVVVSYAPRGLEGLQLGAARAFLRSVPPTGLAAGEWLVGPFRGVKENPLGKENPEADNQLLSLFARWAFPAVGFEVYGEWAREDHWEDLKDLALQPDHSQTYLLGFQQVLEVGGRLVRLHGESAHLRSSDPQLHGRDNPTIYTHGQLRQGYTHRGQILGAAIGPGSIARHLGIDLLRPNGLIGLFAERISHDEDTLLRRWAPRYGPDGRDDELLAGVRQLAPLGDLEVSWEASLARRRNRHFQRLGGVDRGHLTEWNWHLGVGLAWRPGGRGAVPPAAIRAR